MSTTPSEYLEKHAKYLCFHCKEVFTSDIAATEHFGPSCQSKPLCQITREEWENNQRQLREYREDDAPIHREMVRLKDKHRDELRSEEEKGYSRGLKDGRELVEKPAPLPEFTHSTPQHYAGCPSLSGKPICTCGR